jgi:predicted GH43/DUF377 family glycosyl hydrolase
MNFRWEKIGLITGVIEKINWTASHAQVPTLLLLDDRLRVYFSTRPQPDITQTTYCDLDVNDLTKVLYVHDRPILDLGEPGTFDQYGIMPSSVVKHNNKIYLYYSGWSRSVGVPYSNYTGLALSDDYGKTFRKLFKGPVIDRTKYELFSATSPEVYYNGKWHMWYCSGTNWHQVDGKFEHTYDIKYASSENGEDWIQHNKTVIHQSNAYEAITKPTFIELNGLYHMWFCYRDSVDFRGGTGAYRTGYAVSDDMLNWKRQDHIAGIHIAEAGWDSKMQAYPAVIKIKNEIYLFYNGNEFGKNGFGFARLKK